MPTRIKCLYEDCAYLVKGMCTAASIELDPEDGCLTYTEDSNEFLTNAYSDGEEADYDEYEDTWEDEGFEEIDFSEDEDAY